MKKFLSLTLALALLAFSTGCSKTTTDMSDMGYKVGMASYTSTSKSASSTDAANGKGAVTTTYVTAVFDKDDIIKKVYIDEVETKVAFDSKGQLIPGSENTVKSKRELGDAYNMKPASGIGKEWYEQVNYLEEYLVGKKVSDIVNGISDTNYGSSSYPDSTGINSTINSDMTQGSGEVVPDALNSNVTGSDNMTVPGENSDTMSSTMTENSDTTSFDTTGSSQTTGVYPKWQEDLKSSVTIDISEIRIALKKAYDCAK